MGFLLWWLLNISLFALFIVLCFHAAKLIKGKFGTIIAIVFVLGLLSMTGSNSGSTASSEQKWKFISDENITRNTTRHFQLVLKKTPVATYELGFAYGLHNQSQKWVPIDAYSYTNGFIGGTEWIPRYVSVTNSDSENTFKYLVQGAVKWKLLGTTIYWQRKEYSGTVEVN